MKKLSTYIYLLIIAIGAFITSCTDNTFNDGNSNSENASVRLTLCLPCGDIASTRAGGKHSKHTLDTELTHQLVQMTEKSMKDSLQLTTFICLSLKKIN